jgi:hypothetical protein
MFFRKITIRDETRRKTRIIYGGDVSHLVSPVVPLLKTIASSVGQIVPERKAEVEDIISSGIRIEIDSSIEDFHIVSDVARKRVIFGLAALERIWAYTYFYLAILEVEQKHGKGVEIDLTSIPEIAPARALGIWAQDCEKNKSQTPWPDGLPRPDSDDGSDDHLRKITPYFFHAVCFMLLHEIAHITMEHYPNKYEDKRASYDIEFAADEWAAKFMLEKWEDAGRGEKDFIGRCTGIALGIAILVGVELYHNAAKDNHPSVAERLLQFFTKFSQESSGSVAKKTDFPMYLATIIIQGQFLNAKVPFDYLKPYADFTDYLIEAHRALESRKG